MAASKNTSVTLGSHFEDMIERSIATGRYKSASEVVRAGLRMVEEREHRIFVLRNAIEAGEKSGYVPNFDPNEFLSELQRSQAK